MGITMIRINLQRPSVSGFSFDQSVLPLQHDTKIEIRMTKSRFEFRRPSIARFRFRESTLRIQRDAQVENAKA